MRKRKCWNCEKDYPTIIEDDYTDLCSECEKLSINKLRKK